MSYYLGCDFRRDEDSALYFVPRKYVEKMEACCHSMFGSKPKKICILPLEKGHHPELDNSKYLDQDGMQKH